MVRQSMEQCFQNFGVRTGQTPNGRTSSTNEEKTIAKNINFHSEKQEKPLCEMVCWRISKMGDGRKNSTKKKILICSTTFLAKKRISRGI